MLNSRWIRRSSLPVAPFLSLLYICLLSTNSLAQNPPTILTCGTPPVTDTYSAAASVTDSAVVAGPISCSVAQSIATSLNAADGCCVQPFAKDVIDRAARDARARCTESAGSNFACDIFRGDLICAEGCGMTVRPDVNALGCVDVPGTRTCSGKAKAVPSLLGEACVVMCDVKGGSDAIGDFKVACSRCTSEVNCGGLAEVEVEKKKKIDALKKKQEAIQAQLDALDPQSPNYAQISKALVKDLLSIIGELNKLYSFGNNLRKLLNFGDKACKDN